MSLSGDGNTFVTVEHGKVKYGRQPVTSSSLSGDGKTLVTVEHGKVDCVGRPTGDATVTILRVRVRRNVDAGAKLQEFKSEVDSGGGSSDGNTIWGYLLGAPDDGSGSVHAARRTGVPTVQRSWQAEGLRGHENEHQAVSFSSLSGAVERCASIPALLANVRALVRLRVAPAVINAPFAVFDYDTLVCQHHLPGEACVAMWTELVALGVNKRHLLRWAKAYVLLKNVYDTSAWPEHDGRPTYHLALETYLGHLATPNDPDLAAYVCALETRTKWLNYAYAAQVPWMDDVVELPELAYVFALWRECTAEDAEDAEYVECE